jgi:hypothetical protein
MLDIILKRKRQIMGWTGVAGIVVGLFAYEAILDLRIFLIAAGIGLICLAMPRSVWPNFRSWWTSE